MPHKPSIIADIVVPPALIRASISHASPTSPNKSIATATGSVLSEEDDEKGPVTQPEPARTRSDVVHERQDAGQNNRLFSLPFTRDFAFEAARKKSHQSVEVPPKTDRKKSHHSQEVPPPKKASNAGIFEMLKGYSMGGPSEEQSSGPSSESRSSISGHSQAPGPMNESRRMTLIPNSMRRMTTVLDRRIRRSSVWDVYEKAKIRGVAIRREPWAQALFEYAFYVFLLAIIYFGLVGLPLWKGAVLGLYWVVKYKFGVTIGFVITFLAASFYAALPLCVLYEKDPPANPSALPTSEPYSDPAIRDTALLIPCYKSAGLIGKTLECALKTFPPSQIFVIANGNSPTPLDNTEEVCDQYGVNHVWSPMGSKIIAQYVGCYAAKEYKNVLLIDDDCALPDNFPIVSDRMVGKIKCIGYTIKSVGPGSTPGTFCQQAQDVEYKISGLQRVVAGKLGSATFPHGAISIWDRAFLVSVFTNHPGFNISEDWFFGHSCRRLGGRITMCSSVFVETETPAAVLYASAGASRGGFGEMTVLKQRLERWNFFFVSGIWYNMAYIFGSWNLGWWEIGAKIFVFQEVYETLMYLLTPFVMPISLIVRPTLFLALFAGTLGLYLVVIIIFNLVHLRRKGEQVSWTVLLLYYTPFKIVLTFVNVASCYWAIFKYARYFAKRHPKIIEDEKAVEIVLRLEEDVDEPLPEPGRESVNRGRRMTVVAVNSVQY